MRSHYAAGDLDRAAEAARWAAPYCHPKLQSLEVAGKAGGPPVPITFVEVGSTSPRNGDE